jgi:hypothetical protein
MQVPTQFQNFLFDDQVGKGDQLISQHGSHVLVWLYKSPRVRESTRMHVEIQIICMDHRPKKENLLYRLVNESTVK